MTFQHPFYQKSDFFRNGNHLNTPIQFPKIDFEDIILYRYNEYDWCPLDIAIMLNNIPMIRLLVQYGGEESPKSMYDT